MRAWLLLALASCTVGAPPGFSSGEHWTVPLVGPLENGLLLVPVIVHAKGPFLFAIDPDANVTIVDDEVVQEAGLRTGEGPHLLDEADHQQPRFYAEALDLQIGTLTVERRSAMVVKKGTYDIDGRRVHGVIGRDILSDSLAFGFDRDQGVITLTVEKSFTPRSDAIAIKFMPLFSRIANLEVVPLARRLVNATIDGQKLVMHVDLGATASQLRERSWDKAKLVPSELHAMLIDEVGSPREVTKTGVADNVTLEGATASGVSFFPYDDKRWEEQDLDGSLGLGFFRPYNVALDWDKNTFYLSRRMDAQSTIAARIGRWQSKALTSCQHVGCAQVSMTDPLAGKPPEQMPAKHPGVIVSVARDAAATQINLEVLIAVTPAPGKPSLQWLVANLPSGVDRAITHLNADYVGATFAVVDASPFPRTCATDGGCIDLLAAPQQVSATSTQIVPPTALHRRSGGAILEADEATLKALPIGTTRLACVVLYCIDTAGTVDRTEIMRSSGVATYDRYLLATIKKEWRFDPFMLGNKPVPACAQSDFGFVVEVSHGTSVLPLDDRD